MGSHAVGRDAMDDDNRAKRIAGMKSLLGLGDAAT
jgi:hypothetical protein